jgi:hypothetical protein
MQINTGVNQLRNYRVAPSVTLEVDGVVALPLVHAIIPNFTGTHQLLMLNAECTFSCSSMLIVFLSGR